MKILLTIAVLDSYHGSVMHVLELSNYLSHKHEVSVVTTYFSEHIKKLFNPRIKLFSINKFTNETEYDIVWSYHFPILGFLLNNGLKTRKLICGSLSSFEKLETYPLFWPLCSKLHCISNEAAESHTNNFGIPRSHITVMGNFVPLVYTKTTKDDPSKTPRNIAIISNHPPQELIELKNILPKKINIDYIGGGKEKKRKLVTPELLIKYDVIITIGKTAQYALSLGIPVYLYDRFGDDGYIHIDNFEFESFFNFSGRPNKRKLTSEEIKTEIISNYRKCLLQTNQLMQITRDKFSISNLVDSFISDIHCTKDLDYSILPSYKLYLDQCSSFATYLYAFHTRKNKKSGFKKFLYKILTPFKFSFSLTK